ncbi:MAG: DUF2878 family protein [Gammaproteobacteria bacterium]|jgi:hypothetical protein|nr:DUF2878 family protein [Gammaproteobacteria bacterium]
MNLLINLTAFKLGWLSSVFGGAQQLPWLGPLVVFIAVAIHLARAERPGSELMLIASCGLIGAVFDSALVAAGWVTFPSGMFSDLMAPYWIVTMWMLFGTTINLSMRWMRGRPLLAAAFGFVGGPLAYIAGHKIGGIEFGDQTAAIAMLAIGWAVIMPLLMHLGERLDGVSPDGYRGDVIGQRIA